MGPLGSLSTRNGYKVRPGSHLGDLLSNEDFKDHPTMSGRSKLTADSLKLATRTAMELLPTRSIPGLSPMRSDIGASHFTRCAPQMDWTWMYWLVRNIQVMRIWPVTLVLTLKLLIMMIVLVIPMIDNDNGDDIKVTNTDDYARYF